jgi:uncharacterized protein DUF5994
MANGAWRPRSRDLTAELSALDEAWGQINRTTVNLPMRPQIPRKVRTGGHIVRVGWFGAEQDPDDLCPISYRSTPERWDLQMVPPETGPAHRRPRSPRPAKPATTRPPVRCAPAIRTCRPMPLTVRARRDCDRTPKLADNPLI